MKRFHLTHTGRLAGTILCGASRDDESWDKMHAIYAPLHKPEIRAHCCIDCLAEFIASYAPEEGEDDVALPDWLTPEIVASAVSHADNQAKTEQDREAFRQLVK